MDEVLWKYKGVERVALVDGVLVVRLQLVKRDDVPDGEEDERGEQGDGSNIQFENGIWPKGRVKKSLSFSGGKGWGSTRSQLTWCHPHIPSGTRQAEVRLQTRGMPGVP